MGTSTVTPCVTEKPPFRTFSAFDRTRPIYPRRFGRTDYLWDGFRWYHAHSGRPAPAQRNEEFCRRTLDQLEAAGYCAEDSVDAARQARVWVEGVEGHLNSIETIARHVLAGDPEHAVALRILCATLRCSEQPMRALHETAGRNRSDALLLASRSGALFELGRFGGARLEIERSLELGQSPEALALRERIRQAA